jgi:hypothetical protein
MMNRCHGFSFYNIISDLLINHRPLFAVSAAAIVHNKALSNLPSITQNFKRIPNVYKVAVSLKKRFLMSPLRDDFSQYAT